MNITISIKDAVSADLKRKVDFCKNPRRVSAAIGKALEIEMRTIYRDRNAIPNEKGWPKSNFWNRRVANKIALTEVQQRRATVTIASPELIHKIKGGTVTPKRAKTLAIPANATAYRMGSPKASGKDFQFLLLAQGNLVGALLNVETYSVGKKKGKADGKMRGGEVMYWLVRSVTHKPDPSASPDFPENRFRLMAVISQAAESVFNRVMKKR
jgi:hypothetical protein